MGFVGEFNTYIFIKIYCQEDTLKFSYEISRR